MEAKTFYSRLFKRKINPDNPNYWNMLYADLLFRIRQIDDLNCFCQYCSENLARLNRIIDDMVKDKHIEENHKPRNFTGQGYCSRIMKEDSERSARAYGK